MRIHDLRHTFATILFAAATAPDVQATLGHSSRQVTERYSCAREGVALRAGAALNGALKRADESASRRTAETSSKRTAKTIAPQRRTGEPPTAHKRHSLTGHLAGASRKKACVETVSRYATDGWAIAADPRTLIGRLAALTAENSVRAILPVDRVPPSGGPALGPSPLAGSMPTLGGVRASDCSLAAFDYILTTTV